jgi:hypothetical protein
MFTAIRRAPYSGGGVFGGSSRTALRRPALAQRYSGEGRSRRQHARKTRLGVQATIIPSKKLCDRVILRLPEIAAIKRALLV